MSEWTKPTRRTSPRSQALAVWRTVCRFRGRAGLGKPKVGIPNFWPPRLHEERTMTNKKLGTPTFLGGDGFFFKRCAAGRHARLDGPSGRYLALEICPWRASHAGIRGYGPRRPLEARVISARSRPRPQHGLTPITADHPSVLWYTIRLWYDILVFVAVLSFHSARYRSGYGPRRPLEARSRPRLPRPNSHRSPCSLPFGTIRLWYDITVFAAVLSFHSARYRSCAV